MGFKKPNLVEAEIEIRKAFYEVNSKYNDGFTSLEIKKDLYRLKWIFDEQFHKCPTFVGEDEWVQKILQEKVIEILKK